MKGQHEAEMDEGEQQRAGDDKGDTASVAVVDVAEEGGHQDGAEGGDAGEEAGEFGIDAVFHHHEAGGELQEGRYGRIEQYAEQCDKPEARRAEGLSDVAEAKFFVGGALCRGVHRAVEFPVHDAEDEEGQQTDDKEGQRDEQGCRERKVASDGGGNAQGCCSAQTSHGELDAHSKG